jgi:hypothetical protein
VRVRKFQYIHVRVLCLKAKSLAPLAAQDKSGRFGGKGRRAEDSRPPLQYYPSLQEVP